MAGSRLNVPTSLGCRVYWNSLESFGLKDAYVFEVSPLRGIISDGVVSDTLMSVISVVPVFFTVRVTVVV